MREKIVLSGCRAMLIKEQRKSVLITEGAYEYEDRSDGRYIYGYLADYGYGYYMVANDPYLKFVSNDARLYRYGQFKLTE